MKIALITRMSFKADLTDVQIHCFRSYLESLSLQSYKDFTVYILANSVRAYKGSQSNREFIKEIVEPYPFVKVADPERFKYDIEIRLDYDDVVSHGFILDVIATAKATNLDTFVISYQPIKVDVNTGDHYRNPLTYSSVCPSMCMALVQKKAKTKGVYDRPHNFMADHVGKCIVRPEGYFYLQVHGENTLSELPPKSYLL